MQKRFTTKQEIEKRLIESNGTPCMGIDLDSTIMADGMVTFVADEVFNRTVDLRYYPTGKYEVRAVGWPSEPETRIKDLEECVNYVWANRRRVCYEFMQVRP
ncbi:MAG: hypothetical protein PHC39_04660 [Proteiniphilum sp.]|nr:hypothetical protein [Proteiniphilum sp.]